MNWSLAVGTCIAMAIAASSGCTRQSTSDADAVRASLMAVDRAFAKDTEAEGLDGWLAYFSDDSVIFPAGAPIIRGITEIRKHYAETGFSPANLRWEPVDAEASAAGDFGVTWGTWSFESPGPDGETRVATGKYLSVWRRNADGGWKLVADIGNPDSPAE